MMFPVSAFDEDDREEGLPTIPDRRVLAATWEPEPDPAEERFGGSNLSNNLGRLNPLSRIRAEYNDIYSSGNGHGVMNLKELDAYVQETVRAQRQQRRKEILTKVAILLSFVIIASAMVGSSVFVFEDVKGSHPFKKNSRLKPEKEHFKFVLPQGYVMSQCEIELTHNKSFLELIEDTEYLDEESACRLEEPNCNWLNPTIPAPRDDENTVVTAEWNAAYRFNMRHIQGMMKTQPEVDVVLIGDSIVEHWEGKDMGISEPSLHRDHEVFEELFTKHGGGKIDGMAHGIGGDRCANLLYRLENGEMPVNFKPKVWWILIGTEDWSQGIASNAIVAGIAKIAQSIREAHPNSHIVINSILPRGNEERDHNPHYESLHDINRKLNCFVASENSRRNDDAEPEFFFFNATDIFLFRDPEVGYFVNPALLPDYVHPSAQGEEIWGRQIVKKVLQLLADEHKQ